MPYFSIDTNQTPEKESRQELIKKASALISGLLGKPESYVMTSMKFGSELIFAGSEGPAAFVQIKAIGLAKDRCNEYSEKISDFLEQELKIPRDRTFIDFTDLDGKMFGWNGKTF